MPDVARLLETIMAVAEARCPAGRLAPSSRLPPLPGLERALPYVAGAVGTAILAHAVDKD